MSTNTRHGAPTSSAPSGLADRSLPGAATEYLADALQRSLLFLDAFRQRSAQTTQARAAALPSVLGFEAEVVVDARRLSPPANYLLMRIVPPPGTRIDPLQRPFVVIDPRAGHGPGIGGFKSDSEIGVALRAGHPCYLVGFTADPVPGQTLEDVMRSQARFLEKVIELHPEAKARPCVIGNCQAGWALMLLASVRPELCGPIILAGSPVSYWAGRRGEHPMRYTGGLLGGSWMTALLSDLGNGTFNGAYLVQNFENLNPANTLWKKNYHLWANIDTEVDRFLGFEKWWGVHVNLTGDEIQWIVDELFVGNRLASAELTTSDGARIDPRNIRSPIVCFASEGDNITPPAQAIGWIVDLYETDEEILAREQTIIYDVHGSIGHLGIFVSGGVARKEHSEFADNIDLIDILPPGLYEMKLVPTRELTAGLELASGDWVARFEKRTLADVRAIVGKNPADEQRFATVRRVSEINLGLYRTFVQPWVRAAASESAARLLRDLQPAELVNSFFSSANPLVAPLALLAEEARKQRRQRREDNPLVHFEEMLSSRIVAALDGWRDLRDLTLEQLFLGVYGNPLLQALVGLKASDRPARRRPGLEPEVRDAVQRRMATLHERIAEGGGREAAIRGLVYITMGGEAVDERRFAALRTMKQEWAPDMTLAQFKQLVREQFMALLLDPPAALAAIPHMLVDEQSARRRQAVVAIRHVVSSTGELTGEKARRLAEIEALFLDALDVSTRGMQR